MAIWWCVACWFNKATHAQAHARAYAPTHARARTRSPMCAHTEKYVIVIAFPWQLWFHECFSVLRYAYIASLVSFYIAKHLFQQ